MGVGFEAGCACRPRPVRARGLEELAGYRLKAYEIVLPGEAVDREAYESGVSLAGAVLPRPPVSRRRPGVGFVIRHQGLDGAGGRVHYLVLCWWDNGNELFMETFIRGAATRGDWIRARAEGSVCVWDLEVVWHERRAYVRHVLGDSGADLDAYLRDVIEIDA